MQIEDVVLFCGVTALPDSLDEVLNVAMALSRPLLEHLHCLIVTLGAHGVLLCGEHEAGSVNLQPRKQKKVMTHSLTLSFWLQLKLIINLCLQKKQLGALHYPALDVTAEEAVNVLGAGDRC